MHEGDSPEHGGEGLRLEDQRLLEGRGKTCYCRRLLDGPLSRYGLIYNDPISIWKNSIPNFRFMIDLSNKVRVMSLLLDWATFVRGTYTKEGHSEIPLGRIHSSFMVSDNSTWDKLRAVYNRPHIEERMTLGHVSTRLGML